MYYTANNQDFVKIEELECFSNLLLRWPYDTPRKLFCRVSGSSLFLYELKGVYHDTNNSTLAQISKHTTNHDKFDYLIDNYEYLFFLKKEIAEMEINNSMLALIPAHTNSNDDQILCTQENLGVIAAKSINSICYQDAPEYLDYEKHDVLNMNGSLHFGTRNRPIPPDKLWPKIPHTPHNDQTRIKKTELYDKAEAFISLLRSLGQNNKYVLAREVKQRYPRLTHASIGRLFSPYPGKIENIHTLRQRGRRLLGLVP